MTRATFHYRLVDRSEDLQRIVEVMKQTGALMSSLEVMVRIKEMYGRDQLNISTGIGEINKNEGYRVLSVRPRSRQEQHRYALLRAPGWVNPLFKEDSQGQGRLSAGGAEGRAGEEVPMSGSAVSAVPASPCPPVSASEVPRLCRLERCAVEIPQSGPPFCCPAHRDEFFAVEKG